MSENRKICGYCRETNTVGDPYHVHGHNECLCGMTPRHNPHLHDAPPRTASEAHTRGLPVLGAAGAFAHGAKDQPIKSALDPLGDVETLKDNLWDLVVKWANAHEYNAGLVYLDYVKALDALILAAEARGRQLEKDDQSRSDHPQLRACESDLRDDQRGDL